MEEFYAIPGFELGYEISRSGVVRSIARHTAAGMRGGKVVNCYINGAGYPAFNMSLDGRIKTVRLHRVLAEMFKPNPRPDTDIHVNHIDGDKTNHDLDNLEWVTPKGNVDHALETGLNKVRGEDNGMAKLTHEQVRTMRAAYTGLRGQKAALAREYGITHRAVRFILKGETYRDA